MRSNTLRVILCVVLVGTMATALHYTLRGAVSPVGGEISRFTSYEELTYFVKTNTKDTGPWMPFVGSRGGAEFGSPSPSPVADTMLAPEAGSSPPDYSATNIQVSGVDEADTVKTDGEYLYVVSGNMVIIIQAYPAEDAGILSEIELDGMPIGMFINGNRLVVFQAEAPDYDLPVSIQPRMSYIYHPSAGTSIKIYDVSDREDPVLRREFSIDGRYISSRMIGDYTYVVLNARVYDEEGEVRLPVIHFGDEEHEIPAEDIYYCDVLDYSYTYTTIIAINTQDDEEEPTSETILLGAGSNLYVSPNNIYLTIPLWGRSVGDLQQTSIHRIEIGDGDIHYAASGEVPGRVLNQFSMDEHDGHFRIATTTRGQAITGWRVLAGEFSAALGGTDTPAPQPSLNHVYVLNMDLDVVGSVEDLAPTERIFSARFMGDRAYLVTFEIIDPLFVIDLQDPEDPGVLGELKITGYSDYLHPYDENHLIGIGKETIEAESGNFSWFQGVKISLFDVSEVEEPEEKYKYEIGHRGTESPVLRDHKAFLFDRTRDLMVIPVLVAEIDEADHPGGVPDWAYGKPVWQGAYVFDISPAEGITLRGGITHVDSPDKLEQRRYFFSSPYSVTRSLYIGDVLYTISEALIKMHDLDDLGYINQVELPYPTREEPDLPPDEPSSDEPPVVDDRDDHELPGG